MADDKQGRDKQAHDQERRQRQRELKEARERADEPEPVDPDQGLAELLETHEYPATTVELIDAFGNQEVEAREGRYSLEELLESVDEDTFDSPEEARELLRDMLQRTD